MHTVLSGSFHLATTPEQAMPLFTASGERAWAPGWDPIGDDTCWQTSAHGHTTYWLTVDRTPTSARYARITPGDTAGTVAVTCAPQGDGTQVTVTYELHAISPHGGVRLAEFEASYDDMLADWERRTNAVL